MIETKTRKFNKKMGLSFILASAVFYFLPDFMLIDPLPDIIGYVLAAYGLTMLGDICEDLADARQRFMKMIIIGGARLFGLFAAFTMFGPNERPTAMLTVSFVLGVVEIAFLIPAIKSMFEGLLYLGTRHNGSAVFNRPPKPENDVRKGKKTSKRIRVKDKNSYTDTVKRQTVSFIILKNTLSILPEMLALSAGGDSQYYNYDRYDQINYFRLIAIFIVAIAGIVWLRRMLKYLRALMNDAPFMDSIAEKYRTEVLTNESIFFRRRAALAFIVMSIGAFAAIDLYIRGVGAMPDIIYSGDQELREMNVIPDIICAIAMLVGVLIVAVKNSQWRTRSLIATAVYGAVSAVSWKLNYDFVYNYGAAQVSRDIVANRLWKLLTALAVFEALCFTVMILFVCNVLRETVKEHTGYFPKHATIDPTARAEELHRRLGLMLRVTTVLAAIAGLGGVLRVWMYCSESFAADISWIIEMALTAAFAIAFSYSMSRIKESVEEKYMLS